MSSEPRITIPGQEKVEDEIQQVHKANRAACYLNQTAWSNTSTNRNKNQKIQNNKADNAAEINADTSKTQENQNENNRPIAEQRMRKLE